MNKLKKFLKLPLSMKLMIPEALLLTAWYRYRILKRPFRELAEEIGVSNFETPHDHADSPIPLQISIVIGIVGKRTPWESKCLVRALTAMRMLHRRDFSSTLYMGVKLENGEMKAHAWLRCGDLYVTGGTGAGYAVTGIFGK